MPRVGFVTLAAALALAGCGGGRDAEPRATERTLELEPEVVATGLEVPWGVAFRGEREIVVGERPGRIRVVRGGNLVADPVAEVEVAAAGEGGLLGLAVHRAFLYVYYTHPAGDNRVSRFRIREGGRAGLQLGAEEAIVGGIPASSVHDGGRIAFGPDGMLYVTTGDAGQPELAADRGSLAGKILRLTPDGDVPDGNPFPGSPVWSYGHRNVQGLDWDEDGRLYASEHGPSGELGLCCHDEVNLVERGRFYGWPARAGERAVADVDVDAEAVDPVATSGPEETWAPGGLAVHRRSRALLVPGLAGGKLLRFALAAGEPREVEREDVVLDGYGRLRTIVRGPGRCFYLTTSNRDGRGDPARDDDRLLRLCPRG